jgi:hypothetical protein
VKGYFLRNTAEDDHGRRISLWDGYHPGNPLTVVNVPTEVETLSSRKDLRSVCEIMFAKFNRGSGEEVDFKGPSMSVGDLVILREGPRQVAYKCASFGFEKIDWEPRFDALLEEVAK